MDKNTNGLLYSGILILLVGLFLLSYSISTYNEVNNLSQKIDFEELDNNNQMSTTDKYYKYLSYADYLNQNLKKNKNILIKNASCAYLDYAEHNAISLYRLTYNGLQADASRQSVAAGNVRSLYNMLDNYKTCKQTSNYKAELKEILDDIQRSDDIQAQREERVNEFMSERSVTTSNTTTNSYESQEQNAGLAPDEEPMQDVNALTTPYQEQNSAPVQ